MKTLKRLLDERPAREALSVSPDDTVFAALELMAKHNIGAVLVMRDGQLAGIFSERDYARKIILVGKSSRETMVREIMTEKVLYARPEQTIDEAMVLMTEKHIRHLPVLDSGKRVIGMVSIGDVVKETISEQAFLIKQLEQYIAGGSCCISTLRLYYACDTPEAVHARQGGLRIEHRDLDEAINRLMLAPPDDQLMLRRLKKRKLLIKDRISQLERMLDPDPDEYA